jgi:hypothetical protein
MEILYVSNGKYREVVLYRKPENPAWIVLGEIAQSEYENVFGTGSMFGRDICWVALNPQRGEFFQPYLLSDTLFNTKDEATMFLLDLLD